MHIGQRSFAPSTVMTLLAVALCAAFIAAGRWQWERGAARQGQAAEFARGAERVQPLGSRAFEAIPRFQSISAVGRLDSRHQFLLDNRTREGRAGYEVLTPLDLPDGRTVLINRGWLPFSGYRDRLPDVSFDAGAATEVVGRIDELPRAGLERGRAAPALNAGWPKVTTFPSHDELTAALGRKVEPRILLLDPRAPHGYVRNWQPPGLTPMRHRGYAIQWWSFAALVALAWLLLSLRKKPEAT